MSYTGIIAPVSEVRPHPNSDKGLKLVTIAGHQVITTSECQVGQLMAFFPEGGQLSEEFLFENSEYRMSSNGPVGPNKDPNKSGLFEASGRVRTIKLRGEISEGYMVPLENLSYTDWNLSDLPSGTTFTELNGRPICQKYVNRATREKIAKTSNNPQKKRKKEIPMFHEHYDTQNLRYNLHRLRPGMRIEFTEKLHGTSGRTGHVEVDVEVGQLPWYKRWACSISTWIDKTIIGLTESRITSWETVSGSRRVVLANGEEGDRGYYSGTNFRQNIHNSLKSRLYKGETLYYEIVGYDRPGSPLFRHSVPKDNIGDSIRKQYKNSLRNNGDMEYSYGCDRELGNYEVYVYRITMTNEDGISIEYSREQIEARCELLGLRVAPNLGSGTLDFAEGRLMVRFYHGDEWGYLPLNELCAHLASGPSTLDDRHIREGICVRVYSKDLQNVFKYKGFEFCHLEGITKNDDSLIDIEEAS